jgi:hypothetical protein
MNFIEYFENNYKPFLKPDIIIKYRDSSIGFDNNLGNLYGIDIESDDYAGYIYFWDKGFLDFNVINLKTEEDVIQTTIIETNNFKLPETIGKVLKFFM